MAKKRRAKKADPPVDSNRWLGTYGDMVTLLMAFFVMLFAVSETNLEKFEAFVSGLAGPFNNPAMEMGLVDGQTLVESSATPISLIAPMRSQNEPQSPLNDEPPDKEGEEARAEAIEQLGDVESRLDQVLESLDVPISADIRDDERGLVVSISTDEVLFATGSADLNPHGRTIISELATVLVDAPNTVVIEGHTDDRPINRSGYSNWNLSTDRAIAVLEFLGEAHGFPYDRISASGYGEYRPLVPNDSSENRAKNRRVEILIVALDIAPGGAPPPAAGQPPTGQSPTPEPPVLDFSEPLPDRLDGATTPVASIIGGG